jgi:hypothetical protein
MGPSGVSPTAQALLAELAATPASAPMVVKDSGRLGGPAARAAAGTAIRPAGTIAAAVAPRKAIWPNRATLTLPPLRAAASGLSSQQEHGR